MGISIEKLNELTKEIRDQVTEWRRYLHQNPELSFHEVETANFVYKTLESFGNIELERLTETSVVGRLIGDKPGKVVAIRADMDALPIEEENEFEFNSRHQGVMHACGHDGHTAMLLGTAKLLSTLKNEIHGEIRFIFQHAEEVYPGGAEELVQQGVMDHVDAVIGAHLWSPLEIGKIGIIYGPMMASPDTFWITIKGKGGHAGLPHDTIDSIAIGAQVVTNLQHIVSRMTNAIDSLVISVTKFTGGTTHNVIPGAVDMMGTVRSYNPELRNQVPEQMERIIKGITQAHGADYDFKYEKGYRPVINDDNVTRIMEETVKEIYGEEAVAHMDPSMVGEDFSAYQQKAPGNFFFVGAGNSEKGITYPHHHAKFTVDEEALEKGIKIFIKAAFKLLALF